MNLNLVQQNVDFVEVKFKADIKITHFQSSVQQNFRKTPKSQFNKI